MFELKMDRRPHHSRTRYFGGGHDLAWDNTGRTGSTDRDPDDDPMLVG